MNEEGHLAKFKVHSSMLTQPSRPIDGQIMGNHDIATSEFYSRYQDGTNLTLL